jgi:H+-translocating NAD(P) transhydrogenase subunit beta
MIDQITSFIFQIVFLISACGFFICLKLLSSPKTARTGNFIGAASMLLAVATTFIIEKPSAVMPISLVISLGSLFGLVLAKKIKMTAMPQTVAIFNGLGGMASVLIVMSECLRYFHDPDYHASALFSITSWLSIVVGAITFTGSGIAFLKLQELLPTKPILVFGQRIITVLFFLAAISSLYFLIITPEDINISLGLAIIAAILGVLLVMPIGGADMPVVISLLNSYSGLAALAAGFVVKSNILIISGALVGASGIILTRLMCQAMNRSLMNVIFGAFGGQEIASSIDDEKPMKEFSSLDAAILLYNARKVIMVPGYGLAVSQAQGNLRELADQLKALGVNVFYAIHPVAGRMPGHMNVLLAEADVPYHELYDLEQINSEFEKADVTIIVGANDVVNPAARTDKSSPLYGMPILNADRSKSVIIMKRGRGRGFAGVKNPLFTMDNAGVVFGDAKQTLIKVISALKDL